MSLRSTSQATPGPSSADGEDGPGRPAPHAAPRPTPRAPAGPAPQPTALAPAAARALGWLLAALLVGALAGCAANPSGNLREAWQTTETGDSKTSTQTTLLEVGVQDQLGPDLRYRATERYIRTDLDLSTAGGDASDTRTLHQPSLDLIMTSGVFRWTQGFELQQTTTDPSIGPGNTLEQRDLLQKLEWMPVDFPQVTVWIDDRTNEDDLFVDTHDTETVLQVQDSQGPINWLYTLEDEDFEDNLTDLQRDRVEHLARVGYRDDFLDQRVTTSVNLYHNDRRTDTTLPSGSTGALPVGEVFPVAGLALVDTTPEVSVLQSVPGLIDGDEAVGTNVNIGGFASGGETSWNVGVELPGALPVDLVLLTTQDLVDDFLVGDFSFSVWRSDDNAFWSLVTSSASVTYEPAFQRFRIVVPQVTARYLKVVNTASPPAAPAVLISEVRVFDSTAGPGAGQTSFATEDTTSSLNSNVTWRVRDDFSVGADLFLQERERKNDGVVTQDERRVDVGANAFWSATESVDVSVRGTNRETRDPIQGDQSFRILNGLLDVRPLETLDLALNLTDTEREVNGSPTLATRAAQARAAALLLETMQAELSLEKNRQDDTLNSRVIERWITTASLVSQLTRALDLTLAWRNEAADVTGAGAAGIPDPDEDSFEVLVLYQPSSQFTAEVDLIWRDNFAGSGLDQRLRLDWVPLPEGAIDVQFDMQRLVTGATDSTVDRYLLLTRWVFNPRAFLEVNASVQKSDTGPRTETASVALSVRL